MWSADMVLPDLTIIAFSPDLMVLIHFIFQASGNSNFRLSILPKRDSTNSNILTTFDVNQMLFVDHVLRSMARSIFGYALLAYPILPLKSDPTIVKTLELDQ
jgi:hypothetical protein